MCFSPSEETLIASTSKSQLYSITMSLTEISKVSLAAALPASLGKGHHWANLDPIPEHKPIHPFITKQKKLYFQGVLVGALQHPQGARVGDARI